MKIAVKRSGALGDVILTTPIVRRLREAYPTAHITMITDSKDVYRNNPNVNQVIPASHHVSADEFIDLDLSYEMLPEMHIIEAYSLKAFGYVIKDKRTELFTTKRDDEAVDNSLSNQDWDKTVIVHMARSWENRTLPEKHWNDILDPVYDAGFHIITVGSGGDMTYHRGTTVTGMTIQEIRQMIKRSRAFIGMDSGLLHVAGTTETPIYGIFTCAKGEYRMPFRDHCYTIRTEIDCYGCLHKQKPPVVYVGCERGDNECLNRINAGIILQTI